MLFIYLNHDFFFINYSYHYFHDYISLLSILIIQFPLTRRINASRYAPEHSDLIQSLNGFLYNRSNSPRINAKSISDRETIIRIRC